METTRSRLPKKMDDTMQPRDTIAGFKIHMMQTAASKSCRTRCGPRLREHSELPLVNS
jgi:hypothetical protein